MRPGESVHCAVVGHAADLSAGAGQREERHERDALRTAGADHLIVDPSEIDAVPILDRDDRRYGLSLSEVMEPHVGEAQVPDQPGLTQLRQDREMLGDRLEAMLTQIHQIEVIAAERAQVRLDLAPQLVRPRQPILGRADLRGNDQVLRVRPQCFPDHFVRPVQRRGIVHRVASIGISGIPRGGVDVIDA